jgi:hypothetical protein
MTRSRALFGYLLASVALLSMPLHAEDVATESLKKKPQPVVLEKKPATTVESAGAGIPASPAAELTHPSAEEAAAAFKAEQEKFKAMAAGTSGNLLPPTEDGYQVSVFSDPDKNFIPGGPSRNVALEDIRLVVDVEDTTLRDVINKVIEQAANATGEWTVKWRLKPENAEIPNERVNLTAEAKFGEFTSLLAERVRNMTGVQLFMTAYAEARVILITDTFY